MKLLKFPAILFILIIISTDTYSQLWKQYADSAKAFKDRKSYDTAIILYYKAKEELKKDSAGTNSYAGICYTLGNIYIDLRKNKEAEQQLLEAKQVREVVLVEDNDYAEICNNLGLVYMRMDQYEKSEPFFIKAMAIFEKVYGKEHPQTTGISDDDRCGRRAVARSGIVAARRGGASARRRQSRLRSCRTL